MMIASMNHFIDLYLGLVLPICLFKVSKILHAVLTSTNYGLSMKRVSRPSVLELMLATCILAFGGSTIRAIILGRGWPWIQDDSNFIIYPVIAFLYQYHCSFEAPPLFRKALSLILIVNDSILRAFSITDAVMERPTGIIATMVLAIVQGCGGGVASALLGIYSEKWTFSNATILKQPSKTMITSMLQSGLCTLLVLNGTQTKEEIRAIVLLGALLFEAYYLFMQQAPKAISRMKRTKKE